MKFLLYKDNIGHYCIGITVVAETTTNAYNWNLYWNPIAKNFLAYIDDDCWFTESEKEDFILDFYEHNPNCLRPRKFPE